MIVVNFKAYREATGENARKIGKACEKAEKETGERVIACPAAEDLLRLKDLDVDAFAQHIDPEEPGSHTGSILPSEVKEAGATGTLINHSEDRIPPGKIEKEVEKAKKNGLETIVCAQNPEECQQFSSFNPDYIAYEPPELIGGSTSVAEAKPELIEDAVEKTEEPVETLTGAGIKSRKDVEKSIQLGCKGVLVASGVAKAEEPVEEIKNLCEGL